MTGHSRSFVAKNTGPPIRDTHVYQAAPGDWPSLPPPCVCDRPKASRVHVVPETHPDAAEIDARVLGEGSQQS